MLDKNFSVKDKITQLSISSKVISKYTAFVAVEKREEGTEGTMQLRKMEMTDYLTTPKTTTTTTSYNVVASALPTSSSSSSSFGSAPMRRSRMSSTSSMSADVGKKGGVFKSLKKKQSVMKDEKPKMKESKEKQSFSFQSSRRAYVFVLYI